MRWYLLKHRKVSVLCFSLNGFLLCICICSEGQHHDHFHEIHQSLRVHVDPEGEHWHINTPMTPPHSRRLLNALLRRGAHTWLGPWDLFRACCTFLRCSSGLLLSGSVSCRQFPPWELAETWGLHLQGGGGVMPSTPKGIYIDSDRTSPLYCDLTSCFISGFEVNRWTDGKRCRFANRTQTELWLTACLNLPFRSFS